MQPLLVHFCSTCTYNTAVPYTASVFSQNHFCSHCGAVSEGVQVRAKHEEEAGVQQDELARLFSASLTLSQQVDLDPRREQVEQVERVAVSPPMVYASQHYTHSYHVVPARPDSDAPPRTHIRLSELEAMLVRNSIDPSLLFPSQVDLFQNADDDQRLRLLQLWQISPPQNSKNMHHDDHVDAEPYVVSGYDMLARRDYEASALAAAAHGRGLDRYKQATDPVYQHNGLHGGVAPGLWEKSAGGVLDGDDEMVM